MNFYQESFWMCFDRPGDVFVFLGLRAIITLVFLWLVNGLGFRGRTVWICFFVIWTILDFATEAALRT